MNVLLDLNGRHLGTKLTRKVPRRATKASAKAEDVRVLLNTALLSAQIESISAVIMVLQDGQWNFSNRNINTAST